MNKKIYSMYKIYFNLKSFNLYSLKKIETYLFFIFSFFNLEQAKYQITPKKIKKITVLRSPHIDKKSREHFQRSSHKKIIILTLPNQKMFFLLLEIIKDIKLIGVELEILIEFCTYLDS